MKKIFSFLLMSAMLFAMGASVVSCSDDDEGDGIISEKRMENSVADINGISTARRKPSFASTAIDLCRA